MDKKLIATFFTILFMAMITVPLIVTIVDCDIDTSVFYSLNEEEENGEIELKNLKVFVSSPFDNDNIILSSKKLHCLGYFHNNYPKPHLNLISPPPESQVL